MDWEDMTGRERVLIGQLLESLLHIQTLKDLVRCLEDFLTRLISADCLALCVSRPRPEAGHHWLVARMLPEFFARAGEWAESDFVEDAVSRQPNTVLRDTQMISRDSLERNAMYRISHELGMPLEQVMSVYLAPVGHAWHGGFSAYRTRRRPFSEREQRLVQYVSRLLTSTLLKCRLLLERELHVHLFESLAREHHVALLVLAPPAELIQRTEAVAPLVRAWFSPGECDDLGIPRELMAKAAALSPEHTGETWTRRDARGQRTLTVTFTPCARAEGPASWQLTFQETQHPMLATWLEMLTPREREIALLLVQGKPDKEISRLAKCEVGTVKKHLRSIYAKTETQGRTDFIARALKKPG